MPVGRLSIYGITREEKRRLGKLASLRKLSLNQLTMGLLRRELSTAKELR